MSKPRLRFAPSPNGHLHLGHAYSALFARDMAKQLGGKMLLRIEDIDTVRCRQEFIDQMLDDLAWLGLSWPEPVRRQSEHMPAYIAAIDRLEKLNLLYPCFCTRTELKRYAEAHNTPADPDGSPVYSGPCRMMTKWDRMKAMTAGKPHCLRLDMSRALSAAGVSSGSSLTWFEFSAEDPEAFTRPVTDPAQWGDVIIARKDTPTSYHISVVVDDAIQNITHFTRGRDLYRSTDIHRLLQVLLELPEPKYCHHKLITNEAGDKLSKSARHPSILSLRQQGLSAEEVKALVGY